LQSGEGWFSAYLPVKPGRQEIYIPFSGFEKIDRPGGFDALTCIRLSPWKADGATDAGLLTLYDLTPFRSSILNVDPELTGSLNEAEWQYGLQLAAWITRQFEEMGFPPVRLPDQEAAAMDLNRFKLIVLPYNAYPSAELLEALDRYVKQGGKLLVSYSASEELARIAGFRMQGHRSAPYPGSWQQMRFLQEAWPGPAEVQQPGTSNLISVLPSLEEQVLARWVDESGRLQRDPAVLMSDAGIWVSAVLTPDDAMAKRQMLAALVDQLLPDLDLPETAVRREQTAFKAMSGLPANKGKAFMSEVDRLLNAKKPFEAWQALTLLQKEWTQNLATDFKAPRFTMRGIWDANEAGRREDDWPLRMSRWHEAGITDVFIYIPRISANPIRPIRAAADLGLKVHAWHICWQVSDLAPVTLRRYEREGRLQLSIDGEVLPWLCPSNPENQSSEFRQVIGLAETRGLSGLHLDYVRWQDGVPCVCESCKSSFTHYLKHSPDWPQVTLRGQDHDAFLKWRALQISRFVKKVSEAMHDKYPKLKLSAAVWPAVGNLANSIGQDWGLWVKEGWLDFVVPMNYTDNLDTFKIWIEAQRAITGRHTPLIAGIGYAADESTLQVPQVLAQLSVAGEAGATGFVIFKQSPEFQKELAPVLKTIYMTGGQDE
jgi:hypothetical protein